ncbi:DUF2130 domain-containing protein [Mycoplasmopsis bovis]|nr:DUF2130 domain-containing protein [Mycoplasmopsis bovis]
MLIVLGEELENYCVNEFNNRFIFMLLEHQYLKKILLQLKQKGESKGSKGDFIFKVYAEEERKTPFTWSNVVRWKQS